MTTDLLITAAAGCAIIWFLTTAGIAAVRVSVTVGTNPELVVDRR